MHPTLAASLLASVFNGSAVTVVWIIGIIFIIGGVVSLFRGSVLLGIVLIVIGVLLRRPQRVLNRQIEGADGSLGTDGHYASTAVFRREARTEDGHVVDVRVIIASTLGLPSQSAKQVRSDRLCPPGIVHADSPRGDVVPVVGVIADPKKASAVASTPCARPGAGWDRRSALARSSLG